MNEKHCGIRKEEPIFVNVQLRQSCRRFDPFGDFPVVTNPKLPPQQSSRRKIDLAAEQGTGLDRTNGLNLLESVHIWSGLIALGVPVRPEALLQKRPGIIRHKEERAFCSVATPF